MTHSIPHGLRALTYTLALFPLVARPLDVTASPHEPPLLSMRDFASTRIVERFVYIDQTAGPGVKVPLAIGSGLTSIGTFNDTTIVVALSDRGPNVSLENRSSSGPERVVFPIPNFNPVIVPLAIRGLEVSSPSEAEREHSALGALFRGPVLLRDSAGAPLSGLPPSTEHERAVDSSVIAIQSPANTQSGVDPEAITYDFRRGTLWVAEEYFPSIIGLSASNGRFVERRIPGHGLPRLLRKRVPNRGFEAITYTPSDHLVAILQTPLRDSMSKESESFVRMLFVPAAPSSKKPPHTLAIPLPAIARPATYKIGEVTALTDSTFLAIEAYESADDKKHYHLILLDTSRAQEIDSEKFLKNSSEITEPVRTRIVLDFKDLDWASGKIEGLAMINSRTLLISKDNDFGIKLSKLKKAKDSTPKVTFEDVPSEFLLLELKKPLLEYRPVM